MSALRKLASLPRTSLCLPGVVFTVVAAIDAVAFWRSPSVLHSFVSSGLTLRAKVTQAAPQAMRREIDSAARQSAARLEFSTERLDLGDGKPNEILRGELMLTNCGPSAAGFSLIKHCGCTELSPLCGELLPGASQKIRVGLQLAEYANSGKSTSIEVRSGESPTAVAGCVVSARCPAPFSVTPSYVSFGSLACERDSPVSADVRLEPLDAQHPIRPHDIEINHSNDMFRVDRPKFEGSRGSSVVVRVSLAPRLPCGEHYDALTIRLRASDYSARVGLYAHVAERLTVVPSRLRIRCDPSAGEFSPRHADIDSPTWYVDW